MFAQRFESKLRASRRQGLLRDPLAVDRREGRYLRCGGRRLLNFASNDYLGLGASRRLRTAATRCFERFGTTAASSRLVCANYAVVRDVERAFADYFGYADALLFPSGFQANMGVLSALFQCGDTVVFDKHIHASSVAGLRLSRAALRGFRHNDLGHLEKRLRGCTGPAGVVTESLFSMEGDCMDAAGYACLKDIFSFYCVVDEAHAFGVLGKSGRGLAGAVADVAVGTLGKAFGMFGAVVLLCQGLKSYLLNFAAAQIYTTALPPAHAALAMAALEMVRNADSRRERLGRLSRLLKDLLQREGFTVSGDAHILGVVIGSETAAAAIAARLVDRGIFLLAARYPTVPLNSAMLRISLTAEHNAADCRLLVTALKEASGYVGM